MIFRFINSLEKHAVPILLASVILPRILWFFYLGGALPQPVRDQALYIHVAGRMAEGYGFSFSEAIGTLKNLRNDSEGAQRAWTADPDYLFGLAPVEEPTAVMEPGYPFLLSLMFRLLGPVTGAVFLLNLIFAAAGAFAVMKLVSDSWGRVKGTMAGVLWALYPPYIYFSGHAMTETAHSALLMVTALLVLSAGRGKGNGFTAGAATGLFFLVRATALFLLPLEMAWLAWQRRWKSLLFIILGFAAAVSPWVVRNYVELGSPVLMPTKGSLNLWMRNNPDVLDIEGIHVPEDIPVNSPELLEYPAMDSLPGELDRSAVLSRASRSFIVANPRLMLWLGWHRAVHFLGPGGDTLGTRGMLAGLIIYPLMVFGLVGFWRNRFSPETVFLISVFILYLLIHAAAHGGARYRLPVDSVFLIGTALGVCCGRSGTCRI
ncbi:hypothetical protein CSA37_03255 [Candidatus Fermentibacteria bacterium]|nr:MAG: hypothetical protein CSA37_03255 [Candidatus Fermentibacteria bacterium]